MTRQESFKKRIRARMAERGERYTEARTALIAEAANRTRTWVAQPELSDERVREATGKGWDEWCDVIDAWPGHVDGHTAVAAHLNEDLGVDGWWAQTVTVGWERITGRRLPGQRSDGTFSVSKSATLTVDADALRASLLDPADHADLFPGLDTELRSKPTAKTLRIALDDGHALFAIEPLDDGRTRVTVAHEKLATADDMERWRSYWADWLAALAEG